nr:MAG TPA: Minor structural protein 4 [Caudoviricetes sp.]
MTIIQQPDALSLSYNIRDFRISSTASVSFVLKKGDVSIVAQTYEPGQDGYVTIKVRDIIHAQLAFVLQTVGAMCEQPDIVADFTAVIDTTEVTFRAIRSGVENFADTAANFLTANWLTWQPQEKPVTYASPEFLTYYAVIASSCKLKAYYTNDAGNVTAEETITVGALTEGKAYTIPMQYAAISTLLGGKLPAFYDVWIEDGSGNRLTYIQRYYAGNMKSEQEDWILFENSLGGIDTFRAYGATNFTGEHTHNIAEIDEVSEEYRVDTQRKYQKNTGYLNMRERHWLLDFFPSAHKLIYTAGALRAIVVTDSDVTYQDKELPSSYTFTYKYADAKPLLNIARTSAPAEVLNIAIPDLGNFTVPPRLVELASLPLTEGALFPVQSPYDEAWKKTTAGALFQFIANKLTNNYNGGGGIGHTHNNLDLLQLLSYVDDYLEVDSKKIKAGYADDFPDEIDKIKTFLKGLTVGDKASIDKDGNATVQQLIALVKAQVAALEVTGNTKTNSLDVTETAKAKDVEVSNSVTTLNAVIQALAKTHDLTVENTADIMHGIIREYLTSESFVSGFLGSGFKIWKDENGLWHGEFDELTVRKTFLIFELVVQKVVHQGGMVIRSAAGGKLKKVTDGGTYWKCEHDSADDFVVGDQVLCQTFTGSSMKRYWRLVTSAGAGYFNLSKTDCEAGSANPEAGDEVSILGNRTVTARQKAQIDCAVGDDAPYRDDYSGINSYSLVGKLINRTGNLSGITDPDFGALSGSGLYGINVYLKGIFRLLSGKTVETAISDAQAESNAYTDGKITKIETSFEIREGQISSKVTEATVAATNAGNSAVLAQGYASTAGQKASAAAGSASEAANILTTVTQKETSIQQTAQAIELKAVRAESAAGRAESAEASINLKADGIVLQASNQAANTAVNGIQVGGRNLAQQSSNQWGNWITLVDIVNFCPGGNDGLGKFILDGVSLGDYITISLEIEYQNLIKTATGSPHALVQGAFNKTQWNPFCPEINFLSQLDFTNGSGNLIISKSFLLTSQQLANDYGYYTFRFDYLTGKVRVRNFKVERGNKSTAWTPAPENVAQDATTKANTAESNAKTYSNNTFTTKTTYEAGIQILSGQISSKVSQTDFNSLGATVSSHTSTINQLPTTIDQRITSQVADGGIIKTNVESWFTLSGNTISMGAKSFDISGAVVFNSLATQSQAQGYAKSAVDGIQVGGRNLALDSAKIITGYNAYPLTKTAQQLKGKIITISFEYKYENVSTGSGYQTCRFGFEWGIDFSPNTEWLGAWVNLPLNSSGLSGSGRRVQSYSLIGDYTVDHAIAPFHIQIAGGTVRVWNFKFEEGNKATDWTPAPEDVSQDATDKALAAQSNAISAASTDATTKANTAESNAKGYSDILKNSLGSLAYENTVSLAKLGTTIIEGGYLKTALIDVENLTVRNVEAKDSNGNVTCKINGATGDVKIKGDLTVQSLRLSLIPDNGSLKDGYLMLSSSGSYIAPELSDNEVMEVRFITPAWSRMVVSITLIPKNSNVRIGTTIWLLSAVNSNVTISGIGSILGFKRDGITYWIISYNEKD